MDTQTKKPRGRPRKYTDDEERKEALREQNRKACKKFYAKRKEAMLKLAKLEAVISAREIAINM